MKYFDASSTLEDIQQPTLLVSRQKVTCNIQRMAAKVRQSGIMLRPHFKTHQSLEVGRLFRSAGIDRIAVSSVAMAKYFARDGWNDVMIAFPANLREADQINQLAGQIRLGVLVSSPGVMPLLVQKIHQQVRLYLEIDSGAHRTGFAPDAMDQIREALIQASQNPNLVFSGLISHAGHTYQAADREETAMIHQVGMNKIHRVQDELVKDFPDMVVSWGDTPSCVLAENFYGASELRPGNFVYFDLMQWYLGVCSLQDIAVAVAAPVVAIHPERNELVVYGGAVHLSKEFSICSQGRPHYGMMVFLNEDGSWEIPESHCYVRRITQEHGVVAMQDNLIERFSPGMLAGILPVHSCLTADLLRSNTKILH